MNRADRRARNRETKKAAHQKYSYALQRIPDGEWPRQEFGSVPPLEVWASKTWVVLVYEGPRGQDVCHHRISVRRTDGGAEMTWADLQRIKRDIGRGQMWAVEVFPADEHLVDVANMRHLWLLSEKPVYAWYQP